MPERGNFRVAAYVDSGDYKTAIADASELLRSSPDSINAYYHRGRAHKQAGDDDAAVEDFTAAIDLTRTSCQPTHHEPGYLSGEAKPRRPLPIVEQVLRLEPGDVRTRVERANYLADMGEFEQALGELGRAVKEDDHPDLFEMRAKMELQTGRYQACIADADEALSATIVGAERTPPRTCAPCAGFREAGAGISAGLWNWIRQRRGARGPSASASWPTELMKDALQDATRSHRGPAVVG